MNILVELAWQFALLSLLAFGGANAVLPEMHRIVVSQHHWLSDTAFSQLFAIAQAAPGPNFLVVTLVGQQVAGLAGAIVASVAFCLPSSLLIYLFAKVSARFLSEHWRQSIANGVSPVAVGLVLSSGWLIAAGATTDWRSLALTGATIFAVLRWQRNPLWWIAIGALLGLSGAV